MLWASQTRRLDFCSNNSFLLHLVITSVVHNTNWFLWNALHHYIYSEYSPMPQQQPLFYSQSMWFIAWGEYALKSPVNMISPTLQKEAISSCIGSIFCLWRPHGLTFLTKTRQRHKPLLKPGTTISIYCMKYIQYSISTRDSHQHCSWSPWNSI